MSNPETTRAVDSTRGRRSEGSFGARAGTARGSRRVIIVGAPGDLPRALEHPGVGNGKFQVVGVLGIDIEADHEDDVVAVRRLVEREEPAAIIVAGPIGPASMRHIADIALLHHCEVLAVMPTELLADHDPVIVWSGDSPLVQLSEPRRKLDSKAKRVVDIVGASLGLMILSPLIAVLAVLVSIESSGPPIFRHERIGRKGRRFQCLKLRTMRPDAEAFLRADPALYEDYVRNHFKIPDDRDPRVTPIGRFLRRTSLDELPQLWNVLVGEMSIVGPRPVVEEELSMYGTSRDLLLSVRPGLTGAWAVNGRHDVGYPDRCAIELDYVRRWNLQTDASIILRTVRVLSRPN